jgi:hypothetical protein
MRTYFWISLFMSYRITANYLIESNVILIANKEFKKRVPRIPTSMTRGMSSGWNVWTNA